ncbi:DUF1702 family protein [Naumannella cuiyingiana]|uniref:DUF1702 family protein n=1 Tax=Naumannella cuiyingiana TaxID=1347891 RepID=A0A7Z0D7V8_9ACTN|nr:DUF1702 family protein [Naumannella cuiyingiana]NYI70502.1 hypothetical protein [Naumannella cuiyingiana]
MKLKLSILAKATLGLAAEKFPELAAQRVGSHPDMDQTWASFEPVARTLVDSFYLSLDLADHDQLAAAMDRQPAEVRGIAYEGAGMGLMLRDRLFPWRSDLSRFSYGPGLPYRCLIHIGAGLVLARLPGDPMKFIDAQDPLMRYFVADGYGFFDGFFRWADAVTRHFRPRQLTGYAANAYDQGVGRSLWFSCGAHVGRIRDTLSGFPASRQPDLWSGVGLACAYAAGVLDRDAIQELVDAAGPWAAQMATGVAVAAVFRAQSGLSAAPHTDLASEVLWWADARQVAARTAALLPMIAASPAAPDAGTYPRWREAVALQWQQSIVAGTGPGRNRS